MPDSLKSLINENIWAACKVLDTISALQGFTQSLETESLQWKRWYGEEKAELAELPKAFKDLSKFHRLLLLRAIRPDRLPSALNSFVEEQMGTEYVEQPAFNVFETFEESTKSIPLFFVLFPGVDPTPDVEKVANTYDIRSTNKRFINISMG
jgi:dynein heavy chain